MVGPNGFGSPDLFGIKVGLTHTHNDFHLRQSWSRVTGGRYWLGGVVNLYSTGRIASQWGMSGFPVHPPMPAAV